MNKPVHRYDVGQQVVYNGSEVTITGKGRNINQLPVYQVLGTWVLETELFPAAPV